MSSAALPRGGWTSRESGGGASASDRVGGGVEELGAIRGMKERPEPGRSHRSRAGGVLSKPLGRIPRRLLAVEDESFDKMADKGRMPGRNIAWVSEQEIYRCPFPESEGAVVNGSCVGRTIRSR